MATSKSLSSPRGRGLFSTGRKISVTPSKIPTRAREDDEEVYSTSPTKQMKQIRKSKSEKEKRKIYATAQDLGQKNTKWHISLPNIHDVREPLSKTRSKSPNRSPVSKSPLPPPPAIPPPILYPSQDAASIRPKGRELVKSVSAGAINVINPSRGPRRLLLSPQGSPPARELAISTEEEKKHQKAGEKQQRRAPPPKLPPPYSAKARAASLITAVVQEHAQSSTRSAPGDLQTTPETNPKPTETETNFQNCNLSNKTSTEKLAEVRKEASASQSPKKLPVTSPANNDDDDESPLTVSVDGGVKSLARFFSARGKDQTSPTNSPKVTRQNRGRQMIKNRLKKVSSIPETCREVDETAEAEDGRRKGKLQPLRSISNDPDHKHKVLQNVSSIASPGSPTHMSIFSWYNSDPNSKSSDDKRRGYRNENQNLEQFDKTGDAKTRKESLTSPKSPLYKEYQNILVDTGTIVSDTSTVHTPREGSQKKPMPLPRTPSKERGIYIPNGRERHFAMSDSEGALSIPSPLNRSSEYIDMIGRNQTEGEARITSPDMVVFGAMDPEWRENYEEMIEREFEMTDGFSDSDIEGERSPETEKNKHSTPALPFVPVKKVLKKTQSHNPNVPNIQRRNTPKEKRELRKGVCSDCDQLEQDEYIPMQPPTQANTTPLLVESTTSKVPSELTTSLSASLSVPQPHPSMDPRSSNYYLKILPSSMVKPPTETQKSKPPTPAKHYYIEIDIPDDVEGGELSQTEREAASEQTSPTKVSPVHTPSSAPVVETKRKRKLKYPKISVGPATASSNQTTLDVKKTRKTPYSRLKLDGKSKSDAEESAGTRQRSQGSIFAKEMLNYVHRPLPPTPPEGAIYYKTVNHPLSNVPVMRQVWHHEYIEIDESELNQKSKDERENPKPAEGWINIHAAGGPVRVHDTKKRSLTTPAPPIPQRPSCPYVEIDSEEMEELAASLPAFNHAAVNVGPRTARKMGPPPVVPGRPEKTFRQRSFSSSGEYSYPSIPGLMFEWLNMKKTKGDKGHSTPCGPLPASPHKVGKKSAMETIKEKGMASPEFPPTVPPKTESLLREQMSLLASISQLPRKPSPYLVPVTSVRKESPSYDHLASESPLQLQQQQARPLSPKEVISNLKREPLGDTRGDEVVEKADKTITLPPHLREKKKAMMPPSPPLPYQSSIETKEKFTVGSPPKVPKKKKKISGDNSDSEKVPECEEEKATSLLNVKDEPTDAAAQLRKTRLQDRIDRNSLAMIIRNKSAIVEKLEAHHGPSKSRENPATADPTKKEEDVSTMRSLGDILLDVDSLLQQNMCTEDDLIAAIENQLKIKLMKKKKTQERDDELQQKQQHDTNGQTLEESIQVTEQDVEEVVTFMNNSLTTQPTFEAQNSIEEESIERSMIVKSTENEETPTKNRSSTMIIIDDPPTAPNSPKTLGHTQDTPTDDEEEEEGGEAGMRDSRSSSVGLKPLRRVKARRKTNPASDMTNLSVATNHFTQGTGVFTSKGGTLTNLTSEVEIEVPKGAVAPGKHQKLWFEVIQKIQTPTEGNRDISLQELSQSEFSDSNSSVDEVGSFQSEKRKRVIQLSTMVLVGPSDAKFEQPIKIKMPHCLPYRNNSWHLHLQARASNCQSDDWLELSNSSGLIIPQSRQRQRFFKDSTYQMHLHYAVVRTREMGCFKLCGSPIRNGSHSAKKMVASIFAKLDEITTWSVLVVLTNAIHDQIQALDVAQRKAGYTSLEHSVPVLCFGEGKDMELSLCTETNSLPLATQVIPFGQFWRLEQVGQARAMFGISMDQVEQSTSKTLTLKIQQAGSQLFHETNFVLVQ